MSKAGALLAARILAEFRMIFIPFYRDIVLKITVGYREKA